MKYVFILALFFTIGYFTPYAPGWLQLLFGTVVLFAIVHATLFLIDTNRTETEI